MSFNTATLVVLAIALANNNSHYEMTAGEAGMVVVGSILLAGLLSALIIWAIERFV